MEILGHSQLSMTAWYQHVMPELARDAASGWERRCGANWSP